MRAIVAWAAVAVVAVACSRPLVTAPERSGTTNASARTAAGLEKCGRPPVAVPRLESYWDVTGPAKYWVEMAWRDDEWQPGERIEMPYHHATRLELVNVGSFPMLDAHRAGRLRFTIELASRHIRQVPGERSWLATYVARVLGVCVVS